MNKNKNQLIFKTLILCLAIFLLNHQVYSYISANGAGGGYEDPGGGKSDIASTKESNIIETYIEVGGGYFLNSYSNILSFSNRIEISNLEGIDYYDLEDILHSALKNIKYAKYIYYILIQIAIYTPYDPEVISELNSFNYQAFMTENSLNSVVFKEVEGYLKNGDITGTFIRIRNGFKKIEELLLSIKDEVTLSKMPELQKVWEVNEKASNTLIFGQYITMIFYALNKNK